jgi:hypothetical protein
MWYSFEGYNKKNQPIINEVPSGCASRVGDGKHFYYSDDREELYNHWVDNFNEKDEYEKLSDEYSKLIKGIKDSKVKDECYYGYAPFFQYHIAFYDAKRITLEELSDKIVKHMDKIVNHLHVGMVMSEWGDTHPNYLISNLQYNKKTKVFSIKSLTFTTNDGFVSDEREEVYDLKTENGIRKLGRFMEYDRGYWGDLNELIKVYQENVNKQIKFIEAVKKLI